MYKLLEVALYDWVSANTTGITVGIGWRDATWIEKNLPCIALYGEGISDLLDAIQDGFPIDQDAEDPETETTKAYYLVGYANIRCKIHLLTRKRQLIDDLTTQLVWAVMNDPVFFYHEGQDDEVQYQVVGFSSADLNPGADDDNQERVFERVITLTCQGPLIKTAEHYKIDEYVLEIHASDTEQPGPPS